jgi:hypothetical protein
MRKSKQEKQLDKLGELNNSILGIIAQSGVSLSDVLMILELVKADCIDNFKLQLQISQVN